MNKLKPVLAVLVSAIILCGFARGGAEEANRANFVPKANRANIAPETAITATWIKKAAEKHLQSSSVDKAVTSWRIVDMKTPRNRTLPENFDEYEITEARPGSKGKTRNKGKTRVLNFVFYKNDRVIKRLNVTCTLEFFADVLVATGSIRRGSAVTDEMLETASRRLEFPLSAYYTEIAQVREQVALRKIKAGMAIMRSEIAETPDVKSGEIVLIIAENKRVMATAKGVAKKNGKIGEMIPVVNLRSNKKIYARVTGAGQVEVLF